MREQRLPKRLQPMLATLVPKPFDDPLWVYETKWDGFRMIAEIKDGKAQLYSRNGQMVSDRYASIVHALQKLKHSAVLDGELVAFDASGVSRFQLLQNALRTKTRLQYCIFDLLFLDGKDVRNLPLLSRKEMLKKILPRDRLLQYSEHRFRYGTKYFNEAKRKKEEGIMAKRAHSLYLSGKRTLEWRKIKTGARQEVVIVGYTPPRRSRTYFGSLVLAVWEEKPSRGWRYVGHAGTGFTALDLKEMYEQLQPLRTSESPFKERIPHESETIWVRPKLVGEVKFTEWTKKGEMRHPSFIGMREDKKPEEVVRE